MFVPSMVFFWDTLGLFFETLVTNLTVWLRFVALSFAADYEYKGEFFLIYSWRTTRMCSWNQMFTQTK